MLNENQIIDIVKINPDNQKVGSIEDAFNYCKKIALGHYENFPVGSLIVPKNVRKHFFSVYSFARIADDIADEECSFTKANRLELLDEFYNNLEKIITENISTTNPIFWSLKETIVAKSIPLEPLKKLIHAFKLDINFAEPQSWNDLLHYCEHSANPIGELILRLYDNYNEKTAQKSNSITAALQLINFWQDFSVDRKRERNYIPFQLIEFHNLPVNFQLFSDLINQDKQRLETLLNDLIVFSQEMLNSGKDLPSLIKDFRLKFELKLIISAGFTILEKIKKKNVKIFTQRPKLTKFDYLGIILYSIFG